MISLKTFLRVFVEMLLPANTNTVLSILPEAGQSNIYFKRHLKLILT